MANFFSWGTATKSRKPSSVSPAPAPPSASHPSGSKSNDNPPKRISSLQVDLKDEFPMRVPRTPSPLNFRSSSEIPRTVDSGSCSPVNGTRIEENIPPAHIRRIYIVTNADDKDSEPSPRHILSKPSAFHSAVRRSPTESLSPRRNPPTSDVLRPRFEEPTLPRGWECRMDKRSGRIYNIDHNAKIASSHPPPFESEGSPDELGPLPPWWEIKVLADGRTVFVDHETQTTTLRDPRKSRLEETPLAKFIRKAVYLQRIVRQERLPGCFEIKVRKSHVFEDSFAIISSATVDDLRKSPSVILDGLPAAHHATQWSELLLDMAFDSNTGLFQSDDRARDRLKITPYSSQSTNSMLHFKFLGRLHGLCVQHNFPIDPKLVPLFYPLMSEQVLDQRPGRARGDSLIPAAIEDLTAACTINDQANGKLSLRNLNILDGRTGRPFSVEVKHVNNGHTFSNEEDRDRFAAGFSAHRTALDPNSMLESFMYGFWEIIRHKSVFRAYTQSELCRLIGGVTEIDWEEHSERLTGNEEDERIGWFWMVVKSWPLEYREALLRYITGFKRVPITDKFKVLRTSHGSGGFSHFSVPAVQERAMQREDEVTLVHVLLVPNFRTCEELEENLLHTICNSDPEPNFIEGSAEFVLG